MIFTNKYRRRIEVARWKATMKLKDIERGKSVYENVKQQANCIMRAADIQEKIDLLDALLKGKEIRF